MNDSPVPDLPRVVSAEKLAREWGLAPATLRRWARTGEIPARRIGRRVVFDVNDIAVWYAAQPRAAGGAGR